jgi:hypothetical protein
LLAQSFPQFEPEAGEKVGYWRGQVFAVELVHSIAAHLMGVHDALVDETSQSTTHANFRAPRRKRRNFAGREWSPCLSQDCEDRAIERGRDRSGWVAQVHDRKV